MSILLPCPRFFPAGKNNISLNTFPQFRSFTIPSLSPPRTTYINDRRKFHSTPVNNYDIPTLLKIFGKIKKSKKEVRLEKEAKRGKPQDHSKIDEATIKERIQKIYEDLLHPFKFERGSFHEIIRERNQNGSIFDRYCHQFGVDPEDVNTRTRIAQIVSRTLKKDIREVSNEEYISTKRNTLTRLLASKDHHGIFPSLMPLFTPTINLCIQFNHPIYGEIIVYRGNTLTPTITSTEPSVIFTGRTDIESYYTLIMVDLDYPSIFGPTERSFIHWVVGNIPSSGIVSGADYVVPFLPPVPPVGTKIHRIAFVLFQQTHGKHAIDIGKTVSHIEDRGKFNVEQFSKTNHLLPVGLSFFQTKWDERVTKTYEGLGITEPQYVDITRIDKLEKRFVEHPLYKFNFQPVPLEYLQIPTAGEIDSK